MSRFFLFALIAYAAALEIQTYSDPQCTNEVASFNIEAGVCSKWQVNDTWFSGQGLQCFPDHITYDLFFLSENCSADNFGRQLTLEVDQCVIEQLPLGETVWLKIGSDYNGQCGTSNTSLSSTGAIGGDLSSTGSFPTSNPGDNSTSTGTTGGGLTEDDLDGALVWVSQTFQLLDNCTDFACVPQNFSSLLQTQISIALQINQDRVQCGEWKSVDSFTIVVMIGFSELSSQEDELSAADCATELKSQTTVNSQFLISLKQVFIFENANCCFWNQFQQKCSDNVQIDFNSGLQLITIWSSITFTFSSIVPTNFVGILQEEISLSLSISMDRVVCGGLEESDTTVTILVGFCELSTQNNTNGDGGCLAEACASELQSILNNQNSSLTHRLVLVGSVQTIEACEWDFERNMCGGNNNSTVTEDDLLGSFTWVSQTFQLSNCTNFVCVPQNFSIVLQNQIATSLNITKERVLCGGWKSLDNFTIVVMIGFSDFSNVLGERSAADCATELKSQTTDMSSQFITSFKQVFIFFETANCCFWDQFQQKCSDNVQIDFKSGLQTITTWTSITFGFSAPPIAPPNFVALLQQKISLSLGLSMDRVVCGGHIQESAAMIVIMVGFCELPSGGNSTSSNECLPDVCTSNLLISVNNPTSQLMTSLLVVVNVQIVQACEWDSHTGMCGGGDMSSTGSILPPIESSSGSILPPESSTGSMLPPESSTGSMLPPASSTGSIISPVESSTGSVIPPMESSTGNVPIGNFSTPGNETGTGMSGGVQGEDDLAGGIVWVSQTFQLTNNCSNFNCIPENFSLFLQTQISIALDIDEKRVLCGQWKSLNSFTIVVMVGFTEVITTQPGEISAADCATELKTQTTNMNSQLIIALKQEITFDSADACHWDQFQQKCRNDDTPVDYNNGIQGITVWISITFTFTSSVPTNFVAILQQQISLTLSISLDRVVCGNFQEATTQVTILVSFSKLSSSAGDIDSSTGMNNSTGSGSGMTNGTSSENTCEPEDCCVDLQSAVNDPNSELMKSLVSTASVENGDACEWDDETNECMSSTGGNGGGDKDPNSAAAIDCKWSAVALVIATVAALLH